MSAEKSLAGKLAIVTGSGKLNGIGFAVARQLAEHGADLVIHYNSSRAPAEEAAAKLRELGVRVVIVKADASQLAFGTDIIRATLEAFPDSKIDIVINNAGAVQIAPSASQTSLEDFDRIFHANVRGPFALMSAAVPHLASPGGRIINIGSVTQRGTTVGALYAPSKAALASLSRSFAEELGPKGITVNTVLPGPITTDIVPPDEHELIRKLRSEQFIKRNGEPRELPAAVTFAASPEASFFTGQTLAVDGGIFY